MHIEALEDLRQKAKDIRKLALGAMGDYGEGHVGASLSMADILAVLYFGGKMRVDPENPTWQVRDRLVVSKGHGGPGVYAALALKGFFPQDMLYTLNRKHTRLPSHCDMARTPGIDQSTGSLGQGLSCALGQAIGLRLNGNTGSRVFCICGDGELQEGQNWEAMMLARQRRQDNLTVIIDVNHLQNSFSPDAYLEPLDKKLEAFIGRVIEIDGHDHAAIAEAVDRAAAYKDGPTAIIAHTVKAKGFVREGRADVHYTKITPEEVTASFGIIDAM
ncbi:MAG: transketolase [Christensenellales bacterium]